MSGGHLLAAGLDGGNSIISSNPSSSLRPSATHSGGVFPSVFLSRRARWMKACNLLALSFFICLVTGTENASAPPRPSKIDLRFKLDFDCINPNVTVGQGLAPAAAGSNLSCKNTQIDNLSSFLP